MSKTLETDGFFGENDGLRFGSGQSFFLPEQADWFVLQPEETDTTKPEYRQIGSGVMRLGMHFPTPRNLN